MKSSASEPGVRLYCFHSTAEIVFAFVSCIRSSTYDSFHIFHFVFQELT